MKKKAESLAEMIDRIQDAGCEDDPPEKFAETIGYTEFHFNRCWYPHPVME